MHINEKIAVADALQRLNVDIIEAGYPAASEGDFEAAKQLVERYAIHVEPKLHEELLARYKSLGIAPYKGFLNPKMELVSDSEGNATDVRLDYTEAYDEQMLRYSKEYGYL